MAELDTLLIEDNVGDVFLVREALEAHELCYKLQVISDGEAAIDHIRNMGNSPDLPRPDILLLDLNIPKAEGADVLKEFWQRPECRNTPVIVISSSDNPRDTGKLNALGVAAYFKKPSSFEAFLRLGAATFGRIFRLLGQRESCASEWFSLLSRLLDWNLSGPSVHGDYS